MDSNKRKKDDITNNNTNNNTNILKKYKSTDSSDFDDINTSSNTPGLVFSLNKDTNSGETAFWKIFRNKVLFKLIFSNFIFKELFSYDDLIGAKYILSRFSNGEAIIRDKIKSRNYVLKDYDDVVKIIVSIKKDTKENREFYRQLFSIFPYYERDSTGDSRNFSNYPFWIQLIININNNPALIEYTERFQIDKRNISSLMDIRVDGLEKLNDKLKTKLFLKSGGTSNIGDLSIDEVIRYFKYSEKFKALIKIYKYVIAQNHTTKKKHSNIIQQLNHQLESNNFNKIQLKSTINSISLSNDQYLKPIIHNILKVLYSVYKINFNDPILIKPIKYYIYFKEKSRFELVFSTKRKLKKSKYYHKLLTVINSDHCIEYQKNLIKKISEKKRAWQVEDKICFEQAIISTNNLELIDHMYKHFKKIFSFIGDIMLLITKTEVLDYFFNNHQKLMFYDNNPLWKYVNKQILCHFEQLMKSISRKFSIPIRLEYSDSNENKETLEKFKRALNNPTLYIFESNEYYPPNSINRYARYLNTSLLENNQDFAISILKEHIEVNGSSECIDIIPILDQLKLKNTYKFLYWIFQDVSDQYIQSNISQQNFTIKTGINKTNNQKYEIKIERFSVWGEERPQYISRNFEFLYLLYQGNRLNAVFPLLNSDLDLKEDIFKIMEMGIRTHLFLNFIDHLSNSDFENRNFDGPLIASATQGLIPIFKIIAESKNEHLKKSVFNDEKLKMLESYAKKAKSFFPLFNKISN
ncbi:hypothetical protein DICPUDRAFT_80155 [Dictyostelium purpureum]|uniref:Uncharacterized protein n=1 Tax=Dictyostelium purpureum TaxID=5786 RepID=F0ZPP8_DICPU|nr:uncharacterized protein DICPUDRAFT_80155 [Dictyostelium purpureum]EGC34100.1 hypothetical protein DICPUDRAFT_80155 [Dictyostelium purpureum]|eukprot:XP_003289393.1 hypothetical protein DICPUDRAFT_80155 [Dictyostelium purpureum]